MGCAADFAVTNPVLRPAIGRHQEYMAVNSSGKTDNLLAEAQLDAVLLCALTEHAVALWKQRIMVDIHGQEGRFADNEHVRPWF